MRLSDLITSKKIRDGDVEAFEKLVESYKHKVFNYCLRMTNNHHVAEDLAQDIFIKVYRRMGTYDGNKSSLSTWIYAISRNTCFNYLRDTTKETHYQLETARLQSTLSPEEEYLLEEEKGRLIMALELLSIEDREVILLIDYLGLKYREVGEIMGLPTGTVKSRLHGIRIKLKKSLGEQDA